MYLPLGAACFLRLRQSLPTTFAVLTAAFGGFVLSVSLEVLQLYCPGRTPAGNDVLTNLVGALLGSVAAIFVPRDAPRTLGKASGGRLVVSRGLLVVWLFSQLWPFMPQLSVWAATNKLQTFWQVESATLSFAALLWFLAGAALRQAAVPYGVLMLVSSTSLVPLQILLVGRSPQLGSMIGAGLGCILFALLSRFPRTLPVAALALFAVSGLAPFRLSETTQPYALMPFADALSADWIRSPGVVSAKLFAAAATIAVLREARWRLLPATLTVAGVACATELAQLRLEDRSPATTDPAIAALAGVFLRFWKRLS
jgi:hypothetical protein